MNRATLDEPTAIAPFEPAMFQGQSISWVWVSCTLISDGKTNQIGNGRIRNVALDLHMFPLVAFGL